MCPRSFLKEPIRVFVHAIRACVRAYVQKDCLPSCFRVVVTTRLLHSWHCPLRLSKVHTVITFTYSIRRTTCSFYSECHLPRRRIATPYQLPVYLRWTQSGG